MSMTKQESSAAADLANRWSRIPRRERAAEFNRLPRGAQDDFFLALDTHEQAELVRRLPVSERRVWLRLLAPQDAADVLQHMNAGERAPLLELLDEPARTQVNALMAFKEDQAGGLMSPRFARLRVDAPVEEALAYLKQQARYLKDIEEVFVLDQDQHLVGVVTLSELFLGDHNKQVRDVMRTDLTTVEQHMDQEQVARALRKSHLHAIAVVDAEKHMVGVVTVDDHQQWRQLGFASDDACHSGNGARRSGVARLVSRHQTRIVRRRRPWLHTCRNWHEPDFCLARDVRLVWPTLHRIGAHDCVQPRWRSDVRDAGGLNVALHPEACRAGSGERVSSVCCNVSRRHRSDNLFHGSEGCAHGYATVTGAASPISLK